MNWKLRFDIRGCESGALRFTLRTPNTRPFCEVDLSIQLPFIWTIELDDEGLTGNGIRLPAIPGVPIPRDTPWLVGEFEFRSGERVLWRRTGHRVRRKASGTDADYDAEYFNGWAYGSYEEESKHYPQEILGLISRYHPPTGRLLDIGCATGLLVEYALAQGLDAEGIDCSPWAIEKANSRADGRCRLLDFDKADVSDFASTFDIITLHSALEHLRDPERALHLLFNLCRPAGVVYIQTLNADSLMHRLMSGDWGGYTDHTHHCPWITADWLTDTSRRIGFEMVSLRRYYVWNDNTFDDVWQSFASLVQLYPASVILDDQFGDALEVILRRPSEQPGNADAVADI